MTTLPFCSQIKELPCQLSTVKQKLATCALPTGSSDWSTVLEITLMSNTVYNFKFFDICKMQAKWSYMSIYCIYIDNRATAIEYSAATAMIDQENDDHEKKKI